MKILAFKSLEEVNEFLAEQGLPPLPQGAVDAGVAAAQEAAGADAEEVTASFSLNLDDLGVDPASLFASIFGGEDAQEAGPAPEATVSQDLFDSYVEFSSKQITRLVEERDEARKAVEAEIASHHECHEHMQLHIHQFRVQGYAESIAAGLFPGKPFETLDENQQDVLMRQAEQGIQNIDAIRAELAHAGVSLH